MPLWLDFPQHGEEDGTILVFTLRRIGSRGGARRWQLTVGWIVWDQPWSLVLCHRGKRWRHFAEQRRRQVRSMKEVVRWFLSPGVEYHHPNCFVRFPPPPVRFPPRERLGTFLAAFSCAVTTQCGKRQPSENSSLGTQPSAGIKEEFFFYLFCPLVCI